MPIRHAVRVALLSLAAVAVLAAPATASAAARFPTTVAVSFKLPAFHGTLKSPKAGCKVGRTVRLYKVKAGADKLLKQGTSNWKGRWSTLVAKPVRSGSYYVKVTHRGKCKAAKSSVVPVA